MMILLKASVVIMVLLAFYKLVLERESFFAANRIYLLSCLILACTIPFIALPELGENQGLVSTLIEHSEEKEAKSTALPTVVFPLTKDNIPDSPKKQTSIVEKSTEETTVTNEVLNSTKSEVWMTDLGFSFWLTAVYLFGVTVFLIKLLIQVISTLRVVVRNDDQIIDDNAVIVNINGPVDPCSFFKYIFINPANYDYETYSQIIAHEKIHVNKLHTIDLLLSEIALILLWFNPFAWLLRKEVEKNIEYQTDDSLVNGSSELRKSYQLNLVRIASHTKPLAITTNYNQSLIKQRILKMNSKKSNNYSYWKYTFIAPIIFGLLMFLNKPNTAYSQEPDDAIIQNPIAEKATSEIQDKETVDRSITAPLVKGCNALTQAVRDNDISEVERLLKNQDANCIDPDPGYVIIENDENDWTWRRSNPRTPLATAARYGDLEIAKLLVAAGAEIDFDAGDHGSPMTEASGEGHTDFVVYLIEQGADVNETSDGQGSPLNAAARNGHLETAALLLDKGAKINYQNDGQGSPLNAAARNGHLKMVSFLLEKGANIKARNDGQGSALNAAARNGHDDVVELLLDKGASIDSQTDGQGTALNAAVRNGHLSTAELLIDRGADIDRQNDGQGSALNAAARNGHAEVVEFLLQKGADIDRQNDGEGTALNAAARNGHTKVVELLISKGADVNRQSDGQGSALNAAARNGHAEVVALLISEGADVNRQNDGQGSALNAAARNGRVEVVKLLLDNGADIDRQSDGQGSPLNAAARNGRTEVVELLISRGADVNQQNDGQGSALNAAARNGRMDVVELLLDNGADINRQNDGQGSALNAAARNGHRKVVALLISKGADVNQQNDGQGSALNAAARNGHLDVVKLLVEKGAKVNQYSDGQGTALSAASRNRHRRVVKFLVSQGAEY